jgi:Acyl-CoA thioesterase C-terminal domain/Acyl-CoA thioesterase N-terminal domain
VPAVEHDDLSFFEVPEIREVDGTDVEWFTPTDHCRGPWDADACHAGPPTGLLVRAMQRAVPDVRLARITVDLAKPIPMAGFRVDVEVTRRGKTVGGTRAAIVDGAGAVRVTATGLHVLEQHPPMFATTLDNSGLATPRLKDAQPGLFPIDAGRHHGRPGFSGAAVRMRYPAGQDQRPRPTTAWMNTARLIPGERPTPFQAICPLADCGNAFGRHADTWEVAFVNADLTIALHRDPVGEWFGSHAVSWWQPSGVGLAEALLFDDSGPVGRALQTMVLRPTTSTS